MSFFEKRIIIAVFAQYLSDYLGFLNLNFALERSDIKTYRNCIKFMYFTSYIFFTISISLKKIEFYVKHCIFRCEVETKTCIK